MIVTQRITHLSDEMIKLTGKCQQNSLDSGYDYSQSVVQINQAAENFSTSNLSRTSSYGPDRVHAAHTRGRVTSSTKMASPSP